jgi:Tol biopolymer transport system component
VSADNVQELLRSGIDAAKQGDRQTARELLERVVELDERNEKGWLWLYSVSETDEDRRSCLTKVLDINPANEKAKAALAKLEAKERSMGSEEVIPGIDRRTFRLVVGGGVVAIAVILLLFVIISAGRSGQIAAETQGTQAAFAVQTEVAANATAQSLGMTATAFNLATPTLEPIVPLRTEPPTWTPTPTELAVSGVSTPLPPPQGLAGTLVGWSGRDVQNIDYLPVGRFDLTNGGFSPVGSDLGREVRLHPNGQRLLYSRYDQLTNRSLAVSLNLNGTELDVLADRWRAYANLIGSQMPDYNNDGTRVVFVATDSETGAQSLYLLESVNAPPPGSDTSNVPSPIRRLSNDNATYSYPAFSPDGSKVAVIRDDTGGASPGADIVIIDVNSGVQTAITTDFSAFVETMPRWSPDGSQIIYAAAASNDPQNYDIAIRNAGGFGQPILPVRSPGNDIFPVYSPDGRYIAFSSNRGGQLDVYIFDIAAETLTQLTNTGDEDYPGDWKP